MEFAMNRFYQDNLQTLATLQCADRLLFTIELPWKQNRRNVSRIPAGDYEMKPHESGRAVRLVYPMAEDRNPERTYINLEIANRADELQGCIGVGTRVMLDSRGKCSVSLSKPGIGILLEEVLHQAGSGIPCILKIRDCFPPCC